MNLNTHQHPVFEAILEELRNIRSEVALLRQDVGSLRLSWEDDQTNGDYAQNDGQEPEPEPEPEEDELQTSSVVEWLATRHITVNACRQQSDSDVVFDHLAEFLGDRYDSLSYFYGFIKRNLVRRRFTVKLSERSQEENGTFFHPGIHKRRIYRTQVSL